MKDDDLDAYERVVREMTDPGRKESLRSSPEILMTVAPTRVLVATEQPYVSKMIISDPWDKKYHRCRSTF